MMNKPLISMIAAMGKNRVIGFKNKIPWDIPEDMDYLRTTTRGKPLVMGRSTYESVCGYRGVDPKKERAMPGRFNVVVTHDSEYFGKPPTPDGVSLATTPQDGLARACDYAAQEGNDEIFIFGGAQIYAALLDECDRLYLTEIEKSYKGDSFFPEFDCTKWERIQHDQRDGFAFNVYQKKKPKP